MVQLRQGPSGPPILGTAPGQVLVWDGVEWVPSTIVTGSSAFDHVVETLADLPTPSSGVIELTDGSWAFKNSIDIGSNVLSVPAGTTVLLKGMGGFNEKKLSGDDTRVLVLEGSAYIETLTIEATAGAAVELASPSNSTLTSRSCYFSGDTQGVTMAGGIWRDALSRVTGGQEAMVLTGGSLNLSQTRFLAGTEAAFTASGGNAVDVTMLGCLLHASSTTAFRCDCSDGDFYLVDTQIECAAAGSPTLVASLALSLQFIGGRWTGDGGSQGLLIDGNITRHLQVLGVEGHAFSSFIERANGTVRHATVQGCSTFSDVTTGVTWAAANIPTNGLSLVGNNFDTATPISGFTAASARVNSKANTSAGALMQETAIVP